MSCRWSLLIGICRQSTRWSHWGSVMGIRWESEHMSRWNSVFGICRHSKHMSRWIVLVGISLLTACANNRPPSNANNLCSIFDERPHWREAAEQAEKRWGAPLPMMMAFIHQESRFQSDAKPPRQKILGFIPGSRPSDAYGFPQAKDATWSDYQSQTGNSWASRDDFADAVDFVGWYVDGSARQCRISRSDALRQYLAYHEGRGGYLRGTYKAKSWLQAVARKVEQRSRSYQQQWAGCR